MHITDGDTQAHNTAREKNAALLKPLGELAELAELVHVSMSDHAA